MATAITKLPSTHLFSINKETGLPYLAYDRATNLIRYHFIHKAAWCLYSERTMDDAIQDVMLKIITSKYDPKKSAPTTFAILVINSQCERYRRSDHTQKRTASNLKDEDGNDIKCGRNLKSGKEDKYVKTRKAVMLSDTAVVNDGENTMNIIDVFAPEVVTPLDVVLASEKVARFDKDNEIRHRQGKRMLERPEGFKALDPKVYRLIPDDEEFKCGGCGVTKNLKNDFYKSIGNDSNRMGNCKSCHDKMVDTSIRRKNAPKQKVCTDCTKRLTTKKWFYHCGKAKDGYRTDCKKCVNKKKKKLKASRLAKNRDKV